MDTLDVRTSGRVEAVDVTARVQEIVTRSGVASGAVLICVAHTTAGLTINENADPDVMSDIMATLSQLVPHAGPYAHVEGNSDAHVKSSLVGHSVLVPVEDGRLQLGTWQGIYFCEFDGPRSRRVWIQLLLSA
ncbi:MAG: YjbQ family protein [Armatimonadetes bacterium]|nr:YjbQ family protein [Armatimonadota bacterium]